MSQAQVCRICLAVNARLCSIAGTPLQLLFEQLTNSALTSNGLPAAVCYICRAYLSRALNLKEMANKAKRVLTDAIKTCPEATDLPVLISKPGSLRPSLCTIPVEYTDSSSYGTPIVLNYVPVKVKEEPLEVENEIDLVGAANEPIEVKEEPIEIKEEPIEVRQEPIEIKQETIEVKEELMEVRQEPIEVNQELIEVKQEPIKVKQEPMEIYDELSEVTNYLLEAKDKLLKSHHEKEVSNEPIDVNDYPDDKTNDLVEVNDESTDVDNSVVKNTLVEFSNESLATKSEQSEDVFEVNTGPIVGKDERINSRNEPIDDKNKPGLVKNKLLKVNNVQNIGKDEEINIENELIDDKNKPVLVEKKAVGVKNGLDNMGVSGIIKKKRGILNDCVSEMECAVKKANRKIPRKAIERTRSPQSAKMLIFLASGEQRLITFTLPEESCTLQDVLLQVGVQFNNETNIQCLQCYCQDDIDYFVSVGVPTRIEELLESHPLLCERSQELLHQLSCRRVQRRRSKRSRGSGQVLGPTGRL